MVPKKSKTKLPLQQWNLNLCNLQCFYTVWKPLIIHEFTDPGIGLTIEMGEETIFRSSQICLQFSLQKQNMRATFQLSKRAPSKVSKFFERSPRHLDPKWSQIQIQNRTAMIHKMCSLCSLKDLIEIILREPMARLGHSSCYRHEVNLPQVSLEYFQSYWVPLQTAVSSAWL